MVAISLKRIFALDRRQRGEFDGFLRQVGKPFVAQIAAHDEREEIRIGRIGRAVRMIGREEDLRGIVDEQEELEARRPLDGVVEVVGLIEIGHDAGAVDLAVEDDRLARLGGADRA